jgi:hypothetical protein
MMSFTLDRNCRLCRKLQFCKIRQFLQFSRFRKSLPRARGIALITTHLRLGELVSATRAGDSRTTSSFPYSLLLLV